MDTSGNNQWYCNGQWQANVYWTNTQWFYDYVSESSKEKVGTRRVPARISYPRAKVLLEFLSYDPLVKVPYYMSTEMKRIMAMLLS